MKIIQKLERASSRLRLAVQQFDPIEIFGLFSGGHDSFTACVAASQHPKFSGVVHINTGIGIDATREYVRDASKKMNWKLFEYRAMDNTRADGTPDPQDFDEWALAHGFPGPAQHTNMYSLLKERQLRRLERDCGCSGKRSCPKRVLYVTGARSQESVRRMANTNRDPQVEPRRIWVNAIHDFTKLDTSEVIELVKAERNLIVDLIHKSGECLCGAFAKNGELEELSLWPQTRPTYDRIKALERKVAEAGFPWGWEESPPKAYLEEKRGQMFLAEMKQHLCWKCVKKNGPPH